MTTAPAITVALGGVTAFVGVPHEGVPPAVGAAELTAGVDDAPAAPLAAVPAAAPAVHGWVTGGVATVVAGVAGAEGGGFVVVVVAAGGEVPAAGGLVGVGVVDAGAAGGLVGVVVGVVDAGAADVVVEPAGACPAPVGAAAVPALAPAAAAVVVGAAPTTPAVAVAATHRLASSPARALAVVASR